MRMPLVWLNLLLATFLGLIYSQPDMFIKRDRADFVLIASGPVGSEAYTRSRNAADSFERDWERKTTVLASDGNTRDLAILLKRAIALEPRGISLPGNGNAELLMPFIAEAGRRGIRVTFHTKPMPEAEKQFRDYGTGYAGTESERDGEFAARSAIRRFEDDTVVQALIVGTPDKLTSGSRLHGCKRYIEDVGGTAELLAVSPPEDLDGQIDRRLETRMASEPRLNLIIWDAGPIAQITGLLDANGYETKEVTVASFVPAPTLPLVEQLFIKQQFPDQRQLGYYVSLLQLYLADRHGVEGLNIPLSASL